MPTITGLGSFREVGRSAILIEGKETFLLDYGLNVQTMATPEKPQTKMDGIFLSHAHLDHSGVLPEIYKRGYSGRVYGTPATLELSGLMLRDAIKVQTKKGLTPFFMDHDLEKMEELASPTPFWKKVQFKHAEATLYNSGHVPGSSTTLLEMDGKRILYTGDIKFIDTELMSRAYTDFKDIDLLICESTYPYKSHPDRGLLKKELIEHAEEVCSRNGILLLPCFAVGRTQELLQILSETDLPLYLDGMGKKATSIILNHPESVRDPKKLREAFGRARKIEKHHERFQLLGKPGIVITTAGMLNGGPISTYIKKLHKKENCSLYISGFQVEGTVGRKLQDTGRYQNEGIDVEPKMQVQFKDWSAHADRNDLLAFVKKVNPGKIIFNHGPTCQEFAEEVKGMGFQAFAPANGERFEV